MLEGASSTDYIEPRNLNPETRDPKPEIRIPKPEIRIPKPETRTCETAGGAGGGQQHGLPRNPKPETRDPKPEIRNPKPESRIPKPEPAKQREVLEGASSTDYLDFLMDLVEPVRFLLLLLYYSQA